MPVKRQIHENCGTYFITFTCFQWKSLIEQTKAYDLIYRWFDHLKSNGHYLVGYVIMPNHIHVLIAFRNTGQSINTIVGNGKRFLAYGIIDRLQQQQENILLSNLSAAVRKTGKLRNKKHEVWERSFDWKICRSDPFLLQKLNYIHRNPCAGKWELAKSPADYSHSSAKFYIAATQGIYPVLHYQELADIDLTR